MILSHYRDKTPWRFDPARRYQQAGSPAAEIGKPNGLWLSVDGEDDWPAWCASESYGVERLAQRHVFKVVAPERILVISDVEALDLFHDTWRDPGARPYAFDSLRWSAVADQYAGLAITPYLWERRLSQHVRWYYGWDCASACVWDLSALRHISSAPFGAVSDGPPEAPGEQ